MQIIKHTAPGERTKHDYKLASFSVCQSTKNLKINIRKRVECQNTGEHNSSQRQACEFRIANRILRLKKYTFSDAADNLKASHTVKIEKWKDHAKFEGARVIQV